MPSNRTGVGYTKISFGREAGGRCDKHYNYRRKGEAPNLGYIMTDIEKQILLICQEECAEVTQAISKVFRFGYDSEYNGRTNQQRLTEETGDLLCMIQLLMEKGILNESAVYRASLDKRNKLQQWSDIFENKPEMVN